MKKLVCLLLVLSMTAALLVGCANQPATGTTEAKAEGKPAEISDAAVKTGLSMITSVSSSKSASAEEEGVAQTNVTLVAVNVGNDGVIDSCVIDMIQAKIKFSADGVITTDLATEFPSKNELGEGYGMKKASSIGKEWNEQAAAFCKYVTGKTVSEVAAIAVDESGHSIDADLAASCTVGVTEFMELIAKAAK